MATTWLKNRKRVVSNAAAFVQMPSRRSGCQPAAVNEFTVPLANSIRALHTQQGTPAGFVASSSFTWRSVLTGNHSSSESRKEMISPRAIWMPAFRAAPMPWRSCRGQPDFVPVTGQDFPRAVRGPAIDDDDLQRRPGLSQDAVDCPFDRSRAVVGGNDDADQHRFGGGAPGGGYGRLGSSGAWARRASGSSEASTASRAPAGGAAAIHRWVTPEMTASCMNQTTKN